MLAESQGVGSVLMVTMQRMWGLFCLLIVTRLN